MSETTFAETPNAFVAEHATRRGVLPLAQVALIGVSGRAGEMRALIRMGDGTMIAGTQGEYTALGRLLEVSPAGVVLERSSGNATFLRPYPWGAQAQ